MVRIMKIAKTSALAGLALLVSACGDKHNEAHRVADQMPTAQEIREQRSARPAVSTRNPVVIINEPRDARAPRGFSISGSYSRTTQTVPVYSGCTGEWSSCQPRHYQSFNPQLNIDFSQRDDRENWAQERYRRR